MGIEPSVDGSDDARPAPDDRRRIRVARHDVRSVAEPAEIVRGGKPGTRFARRIREAERHFRPSASDGVITATPRATAPRSGAERAWARVRAVALGSPISSEHQEEQRLSKRKALAVFSSDALSSSAYATDEILLYLSVAGLASLVYSVPIAAAIAVLLAIVADRGLVLLERALTPWTRQRSVPG